MAVGLIHPSALTPGSRMVSHFTDPKPIFPTLGSVISRPRARFLPSFHRHNATPPYCLNSQSTTADGLHPSARQPGSRMVSCFTNLGPALPALGSVIPRPQARSPHLTSITSQYNNSRHMGTHHHSIRTRTNKHTSRVPATHTTPKSTLLRMLAPSPSSISRFPRRPPSSRHILKTLPPQHRHTPPTANSSARSTRRHTRCTTRITRHRIPSSARHHRCFHRTRQHLQSTRRITCSQQPHLRIFRAPRPKPHIATLHTLLHLADSVGLPPRRPPPKRPTPIPLIPAQCRPPPASFTKQPRPTPPHHLSTHRHKHTLSHQIRTFIRCEACLPTPAAS